VGGYGGFESMGRNNFYIVMKYLVQELFEKIEYFALKSNYFAIKVLEFYFYLCALVATSISSIFH
jgi:hypothetical protein